MIPSRAREASFMPKLYEDKRITCDDEGITVRRYYFPLGDKRIAYDEIRWFDQQRIGALTGQYRIWGAGDPRYWFHLDATRTKKTKAIVIDKGDWVKAVITPDDPEAVLHILEDKVRRSKPREA
jgi:hypothetical protein